MLYETIKRLAKSKKIPIYKIEKELGVSKGSICKWGNVKPSYDKICRVAKILGISVEDVVDGAEKMEATASTRENNEV